MPKVVTRTAALLGTSIAVRGHGRRHDDTGRASADREPAARPGYVAQQACGPIAARRPSSSIPAPSSPPPRPRPPRPSPTPTRADDLGTLTDPVTTRSPEAQRFFDQGLRLAYAFNHGEAVRAFRAAQKIDPTCAMCYWGEAFVLGPNINYPMQPEAVAPAFAAVAQAMALRAGRQPARAGADRSAGRTLFGRPRRRPQGAGRGLCRRHDGAFRPTSRTTTRCSCCSPMR